MIFTTFSYMKDRKEIGNLREMFIDISGDSTS